MEALYREIAGIAVQPIRRDEAIPRQYRQTLNAPLAPIPNEAEQPPIIEPEDVP